MGIHAGQAATIAANADDLASGSLAFAKKISASRKHAMHCKLSEEESRTLHETMEDTLDQSRDRRKN